MLINLSITIFWSSSVEGLKPLSLLLQTHYHLLEAILGFCSCVYQRPEGVVYPPLSLNLNPTQADVRDFREFKGYLATGNSIIVESQTGEQLYQWSLFKLSSELIREITFLDSGKWIGLIM